MTTGTLSGTAVAARETHRDTRGRFGAQPAAEADPVLDAELVRDARGMRVAVTPGLVDQNAQHLYRNGQCLALALALARCRENTGVVILAYEGDDGGTYVQHAWATSDDGWWYDVDGQHDPEAIEEALANGGFDEAGDDYTTWHEYGADELDLCQEESVDWIGPQRHDLAASMTGPLWGQLGVPAQ